VTSRSQARVSVGVVEELVRAPPRSIGAILATPADPPASPGFYAWWARRGALPDVPWRAHPTASLGLLYIGIAPSRVTSRATLRSRLLRQHIGGNVGSSTFRLGLAALLWETNGWVPRLSASGRPALSDRDNQQLSEWQQVHLQVSWATVGEPWSIEALAVASMAPPMNREHNHDHPFCPAMGSARDRFRAVARAS